MFNNIKEKVTDIYNDIVSWRRHIHQNPELSFEEFETSKFIQNKLSEFGINFQVIARTGVVATIGKGEKCVALRADIDALPIFEETQLEFKSIKDGIMHACGHDMHTSMLLGAAKILKENENSLNGIVKLIFQPGEEKLPGGASIMIEEGVLENPRPSAIFGQHIYPAENTGVISMCTGAVMGSADEIYWEITGKSTHAAQPHLGSDPILTASQLITYYQTLMTKFRDPLISGVLTVSSINGGFATNVIPDKVKLMGTLRSFDEAWRLEMHKLIEEKSPMLAALYNCEIKVEIRKGYPHVFNNVDTTNFAKNIALELFGNENYTEFIPKMWGEDFAFYGRVIPATFWFVGVKPNDLETMPALHNSKLNPEEQAMINGTTMLIATAMKYLENY